jgi:hypothetical protein
LLLSVAVTEIFEGETVWDGAIQIFELIACMAADGAYACSYETEGGRRPFFAVPHKPSVTRLRRRSRSRVDMVVIGV